MRPTRPTAQAVKLKLLSRRGAPRTPEGQGSKDKREGVGAHERSSNCGGAGSREGCVNTRSGAAGPGSRRACEHTHGDAEGTAAPVHLHASSGRERPERAPHSAAAAASLHVWPCLAIWAVPV